MKLTVKRFSDNGNATLGALYIDGVFECFTVEDEKRHTKVKGETRIPEATYIVDFRKEGKLHQRYSAKYGKKHHGMLHILDVPNFQFILIHIGNTEKDTDGCLLLGDTALANHTVTQSTVAYERVYNKVSAALLAGDRVTIEYIDSTSLIK